METGRRSSLKEMRMVFVHRISDKRSFDEVLDVFGEYVEQSPYLEIVRTQKFGYCKLVFNEPDNREAEGELSRLQSSEELLEVIYGEILSDVRELQLNGEHRTNQLTRDEAEEICRRVDALTEKAGERKPYYMECLRRFLENYKELWGACESADGV